MAFTLPCPACQNSLRLEATPTAGQRLQCPTCGETFHLIHGLPHAIQKAPTWSVDFGSSRDDERYRPGAVERETIIPTQTYPKSGPSVRAPSRRKWLPTLLLLTLAGLLGWGAYRFWNGRPRAVLNPQAAQNWLSFLPAQPELILGVQPTAIPPKDQRGPVWEVLVLRQTKDFFDFAPHARQLVPLSQRYLLVENRPAFGSQKLLVLEGQQPFPEAHVRELLQAGPVQKLHGRDAYSIPLTNPEAQGFLLQPSPKNVLLGELPEKEWALVLSPDDPERRIHPLHKEMIERVDKNYFWAVWSPTDEFDFPIPIEDDELRLNLPRVQRIKGFFLGLHPEKTKAKLVVGVRCAEEEDASRLHAIARRLWRSDGQEGLKTWSAALRDNLPDAPWDTILKEIHTRVEIQRQGTILQATLILPDGPLREVEKLMHVLQQLQ